MPPGFYAKLSDRTKAARMPPPDAISERTQVLIGEAGLARLAAAHVVVAGLGGVGSACAEALARAGVGALTLIDHDVVVASNLNRQWLALRSTVGLGKAELMAGRVRDIRPDCRLTVSGTFLNGGNVAELVPADADFVVDAIDALNPKVALLVHCHSRRQPVATSVGAGNRLDPCLVRVGDIAETHGCRFARKVRQRLGRQGVRSGILAVYSVEAPHKPLPPQPVPGPGRPRAVNGTISYLPPLFGLMLAGEAVRALLGGFPRGGFPAAAPAGRGEGGTTGRC